MKTLSLDLAYMTSNPKLQWLLLFTVPTLIGSVCLGIVHQKMGSFLVLPFLLLLGGMLGIPLGFSDAPVYDIEFKMGFGFALAIALFIFAFSWANRDKFWGKCLVAFAVHLWCFAGMMALGMSG